MSRVVFAWALIAALGLGFSACKPAEEKKAESAKEEVVAVIQVKDYGEIRFSFFPDKAPGHVENFKKLAREGFYNGTTFHRVIPGFMIQGGDPNSKDDIRTNDGQGGPGYTIPAEFNDIPHARGIVSMARASQPDSAGSQFFIMLQDSAAWPKILDGKYTVFGKVESGMEVVDKIADVDRDARDRPKADVVMASVTIEPTS
jgi:peptidyl-prolyl cis-trans isomerase B (cyclophilin B)